MSALSKLRIPSEALTELCRRLHIRKLAFFGSVLRDDFRPDSDLDVLVEFEPETRVGFLGMVRIQEELEKMFGRRVDLRTPAELSRYFRDHVLREASVLYAEG